mgnify:CR=1 FL=1
MDVNKEWKELNGYFKIIFILLAIYIGTDLLSFIYGVGKDLGDVVYYNVYKPFIE